MIHAAGDGTGPRQLSFQQRSSASPLGDGAGTGARFGVPSFSNFVWRGPQITLDDNTWFIYQPICRNNAAMLGTHPFLIVTKPAERYGPAVTLR